MTQKLIAIFLNAFIILLCARVTPGVKIRGYGTAIIVALVYGTLTFLFKWLFVLLALPLVILSFGLFILVINAMLLWATDRLIDDFEIRDNRALFLMTIGMTIGSVIIDRLI